MPDTTASAPTPVIQINRLAERIRTHILHGEYAPGQRLSEAGLTAELGVSRNTLREVFRLLTKDRLLRYQPNKGVAVATPDVADVLDIFRLRRVLECQALLTGRSDHPATAAMRDAVEQGQTHSAGANWRAVGTANMAFHLAIIHLLDSQRLSEFFSHCLMELRLAFGLLEDPEHLHAPFVVVNQQILELFLAGKAHESATLLENYLQQAQRMVTVQRGN